MSKLCIIIHTSDKYNFCWDGWNSHFQKNWNHNLNVPVFFVNENVDANFNNIIQYKTGTNEWSDRLLNFLVNNEFDHVFYMQEDMWITREIDFDKYYHDFILYDLDALRLLNEIGGDNIHYKFTGEKDGYLIFNQKTTYILSHQPSFWKRQFLIDCLDPGETPWNNEINGSIRINNSNKEVKIWAVKNLPSWYTPVSNKGNLTNEGLVLLKQIKDEI